MGNGKYKIIFLGTPAICLPFLKDLHQQFYLKLIITQPDARGGRNKKKIIPAVKSFALENQIPFIQPDTLKDDQLADSIKAVDPKISVVISYGKIIPKRIFRIPEYHTINLHFSLLPFYRGAAPVQRALENGDKKTGITIFEIGKKMDSGDIWAQKEFEIFNNETAESLFKRMSQEGVSFLVDTLNNIFKDKLEKKPQDHSKATLAPLIKKEEGHINWNLPAEKILDKFRAFYPWPGLFCIHENKLFKLSKIKQWEPMNSDCSCADKKPGDVVEMTKKGLRVCCGENTFIEILEFQPQGKKPMTPFTYCLGNPLPDSLI
jgi:methionyl-tRNA formyltransferase